MTFTPVPESPSDTALSLDAESLGARSTQAQVFLVDGLAVVTTTADSGPGSLRQAILDSNALVGGTNTIDFAIRGSGLETIAPITPLPAITTSVLIDGTTQPGFAGTPLVALGGPSAGNPGPLVIAAGDVTIRGVATDGVMIDPASEEGLVAVLHVPAPVPRWRCTMPRARWWHRAMGSRPRTRTT